MRKSSLMKISIQTFVVLSLIAIPSPTGLTQPKQADFVSPEDFGASSDGVKDDTTSVQNALNTGKDVRLSKKYSISMIYTTKPNQRIFGGGTVISRSKTTALLELRQAGNIIDTVKFDTTQQSSTYTVQVLAKNTQIKNSTFTGNTGHYIVTNSEGDGILITKNEFVGKDYNQVTPVVINSIDGFSVTDNSFTDVTGFNLQTRWSTNGKIVANTFRNPTYLSSKVSIASQSNIELDLPVKVNRIGLRIDGRVVPKLSGPIGGDYYFTAVSKDGKRFTLSLNDKNKNAYKLKGGEKIELVGWRSLENININAGSKNIEVSNNTIEGSGDGGIVIASDYNKNRSLDPSNPADAPSSISITRNDIRDINAEGIGVLMKSANIVISDNKISDCGQGIGGYFSSCIFAADSSLDISNNTCTNSSSGITLYKIFFSNAPQSSQKI